MDIRLDSLDTVPSCSLKYSYGWYYAYISVDVRIDSVDTVPSCSRSILMVGIMLIFPSIRDSIVVDTAPPCNLGISSYGWYYAYISVDIRLDCVDTVPSCSLSILIVGIMLIFPFIRDSIVLI